MQSRVNQDWIRQSGQFIHKNLGADLKRVSGVFVPDDNFYRWTGSIKDLNRIGLNIARWLYLKLEKDELRIGFDENIGVPGLYTVIRGQKTILVNSKYRKDVFIVSAILAHEIMHFYLLGKKNIKMKNSLENELLTDLCTIKFGLGLVVINGMSFSSNWVLTFVALFAGFISFNAKELSFGYFSPYQYGKMVYKDCLYHKNLDIKHIGGFIKPNSRIFLSLKFWEYWGLVGKSKIVKKLEMKWILGNVFGVIFLIGFINLFLWNLSIERPKTVNDVPGKNLIEAAKYFPNLEMKISTLNDAGFAFEKENNSKEAIGAYEQILALTDETNPYYFYAKGRIEEIQSNEAQAEIYFQRARDLIPVDQRSK